MSLADSITQTDRDHIRSTGRDPSRVLTQLEHLLAGKTSGPIVRPAAIHDGIRRGRRLRFGSPASAFTSRPARPRGACPRSFPPRAAGRRNLSQACFTGSQSRNQTSSTSGGRATTGRRSGPRALIVLDNITGVRAVAGTRTKRLLADLARAHSANALWRGWASVSRGTEGPGAVSPLPRRRGAQPSREHLNESAAITARADKNTYTLHFTIGEAQHAAFPARAEHPRRRVSGRRLGVQVRGRYSVPSPATDTIAVDHPGAASER